ncbi:hypothetical protein B0H63DRAFT_528636 [Podospora didyma]|uniref:Uncharacterized protein n=1 Tax=Podospora didyma TaxID=330526 RepID=A0AAE0N2X3_9PEZI|nr:hypothetical protein B0H63DRAFT_528636 [Podospora didyma]
MTTSTGSASGSAIWCWNAVEASPTPQEDGQDPLTVANITLILGLEEQFKSAIKIVVWNLARSSLVGVPTPVERLQQGGTLGLENIRTQELEEVKTKIKNLLKEAREGSSRDDLDVKWVEKKSSSLAEGHAGSIYDYVRRLQQCLVPGNDLSLDRNNTAMSTITNETVPAEGAKSNRGGGAITGEKWVRGLGRAVKKMSGASGGESFGREMLGDLHTFIEERQDLLAQRIIDWRNVQVKGWEDILAENSANSTSNEQGETHPRILAQAACSPCI